MGQLGMLCLLLMVMLCLFFITGCHPVTTFTSAAYEETEPESFGSFEKNIHYLQNPDWGLTLSAKDVTSTGMTMVFTQSGGKVTGHLSTAVRYQLRMLTDYGWVNVEQVLPEEEVYWDLSARAIPLEGTVETQVDWEWLYGQLTPGSYRISQEIRDYRNDADYDETVMWLEFEIHE